MVVNERTGMPKMSHPVEQARAFEAHGWRLVPIWGYELSKDAELGVLEGLE